MDITVFLAQIWGPVMLVLGLGMLVSRNRYRRMCRELGQKDFSVLLFALLAVVGGVVQIGVHNSWGSLVEVIISLLGWSLLVKGVVFAIFPRLVGKVAKYWADSTVASSTVAISTVGAVVLIIGGYLSWVGFLA
jgi:hypothetical protein